MAFKRNVFSTKDEIRNSVWRCNHQPILITLHDHYILFEEIMSETVIFYKHIVSIKKSIETIHWDGHNDGGTIYNYKLILKTAAEDFTLSAELSPSVIDNDLYSQIINKITKKTQYDEHFMKICRNCGKKHYSDDDNYCSQCGTKLIVKPAPQTPTGNPGDEPEPPEPPQTPTGNPGGEIEPPGFGVLYIRGLGNEIGKVPMDLGEQKGGAPTIYEEEIIDFSDKTTEELLVLREKYIINKMGALNDSEREYAVIQLKYITKELRRRNVEIPVHASKADSNYNE